MIAGDSIKKVLDMAGGLKARGNARQVVLNRYEKGRFLPSLLTLNLLDPTVLEMALIDGDQLKISSVTEG